MHFHLLLDAIPCKSCPPSLSLCCSLIRDPVICTAGLPVTSLLALLRLRLGRCGNGSAHRAVWQALHGGAMPASSEPLSNSPPSGALLCCLAAPSALSCLAAISACCELSIGLPYPCHELPKLSPAPHAPASACSGVAALYRRSLEQAGDLASSFAGLPT